MQTKFFTNKVMQIAIELKYQCPLLETEFVSGGCDCGANARFPGPCAQCATRELARLIGKEDASEWLRICLEEQRVWRAMCDKAANLWNMGAART